MPSIARTQRAEDQHAFASTSEERTNTLRREISTSLGPWLDAAGAAVHIGVAIGTIRNWTSQRFVPHVKRGRIVRYNRDELDRWLASGARPGRKTHAN